MQSRVSTEAIDEVPATSCTEVIPSSRSQKLCNCAVLLGQSVFGKPGCAFHCGTVHLVRSARGLGDILTGWATMSSRTGQRACSRSRWRECFGNQTHRTGNILFAVCSLSVPDPKTTIYNYLNQLRFKLERKKNFAHTKLKSR